MSADRFIARRLRSASQKHTFTRVVLRIAIVSVALSLAVMICSSALISGFKKEISQKIFDFWGHIHITEVFIAQTLEPAPIEYDQTLVDSLLNIGGLTYGMPTSYLDGELQFRPVTTNGGIRSANPYIQFAGIMSAGDDIEGLILKGVGPDYSRERMQRYLRKGEWFNWQDSLVDRSLLISQTTAERMRLDVGDQVVMHFVINGRQIPRRLRVKGIFKTGLGEYDRKIALVTIPLLQEVQDWPTTQVSGIELLLDDLDDMEVINSFVYHEVLPPELSSQSVRERSSAIFDWLDLQDINEWLILGLMLVVCLVNMITTMMILILERTNMIGVLKAMGSTNWTVRKVFIRQAAYILCIGLLIGNVIGLSLCFLQEHFQFITLNEADYYLDVAPIHVNFWMVLFVNVATLVITVLFLIVPSYLISKISPSRAIRFS